MSKLILYNYDLSPFSEKMRLMLGYAGLPWHSVTVSPMPPRPELETLAGGYRKIPVAQVGADVYCDTRSIAAEIARQAGKPELVLHNCSEEAQAFARKADLEIFLATVILCGGGMLRTLVRETSLWMTLRFLKDRIGIARTARAPSISPKRAKALIAAHLADMENLLTQDFLFADKPCAADFSAYVSLWTASRLGGKQWLGDKPRVADWYARMSALGHGSVEAMTAGQGLDIARDAQPQDQAGKAARRVSIAPDDYARDPVVGALVSESEHGWVLQRQHARVGDVHLHFPRSGFSLRDAD